MNLENYFISQFNNKHIGDDAAVIDDLVYSKDAFFENVHFKTSWMSHYQIAKKAMLVNISDAIAMNAKPLFALLSVAMPKEITKGQMRELAQGFRDAANDYNIEIIGGDTISNTKLDMTVSIISKTNTPLYRTKIRNGYLFAYTGELGSSAKDLKKLMNLGSINKKSKFVNIKLRQNFIEKSRRILQAGMDISDGLYSDLDKMASLNNIGVKFTQKILKQQGCSGEEYEMLIAFDKRDRLKLLRRAQQTRTPLTIFARAIRSKYTNRCKAHHF
ncbi:thiamine-phosphate kinase [Sulfurimonas sp.]